VPSEIPGQQQHIGLLDHRLQRRATPSSGIGAQVNVTDSGDAQRHRTLTLA
jgi:hypothetical protein